MFCSAIALTCAGLLACGGAIQQDESSGGGGTAKTTFGAPITAASISPYGAWELTSLDGSPAGSSTQTFGYFFLDLRADGKAIARQCAKPSYDGSGAIRCADANAYVCFLGTVAWDGEVYRVDVPGLRAAPNQARGEIVADNDRIVVHDILPTYASGRFAHVMGDSPTHVCSDP